MSSTISANSYGKSLVRLTKVTRGKDRHELKEMAVDICLEGDFEEVYTTGDNSKCVATDPMKNTVYGLAAKHELANIESFAETLCRHFLDRNKQVRKVTVEIKEDLWLRLPDKAGEHPHAFMSAGKEKRTAEMIMERSAGKDYTTSLSCGIDEMVVLKTTDSAFFGFIRDEFTTLPESKDRIFATAVEARWTYKKQPADFNKTYELVRKTMLDVFAHHKSLSVQQTMYAMGEGVFEAVPEVADIHLRLPNQHRIPFNLEPLGLKNENCIFVPTTEPYGNIKVTLTRQPVGAAVSGRS